MIHEVSAPLNDLYARFVGKLRYSWDWADLLGFRPRSSRNRRNRRLEIERGWHFTSNDRGLLRPDIVLQQAVLVWSGDSAVPAEAEWDRDRKLPHSSHECCHLYEINEYKREDLVTISRWRCLVNKAFRFVHLKQKISSKYRFLYLPWQTFPAGVPVSGQLETENLWQFKRRKPLRDPWR